MRWINHLSCAACAAAGLVLPASVHAQYNVTAGTSSPAIVYKGDWVLTEGRLSHIASQPGSTATFTFTGTYLAWRSTRSSRQGIETIQVDSQSWSVDTTWRDESVAGDTVVVFELGGMPATQHTAIITKVSSIDRVAVVWDFIYTKTDGPPIFRSDGSYVASSSSIARSPTEASSAPISISTSSTPSSTDASSVANPTSIVSSDASASDSSTSGSQTETSLSNALISTPPLYRSDASYVIPSSSSTFSSQVDSSRQSAGASNSSSGPSSSSTNGLKIGLAAALGVMAIVLLAMLVLLLRRRRRQRRQRAEQASQEARSAHFEGPVMKEEDIHGQPLIPSGVLTISTLSASPSPSQPSASSMYTSMSTSPAQAYARQVFDIDPSGPSDTAASTLLSDGTGRRERPPSYALSPSRSIRVHEAAANAPPLPQNLAVYLEGSSAASMFGDVQGGKGAKLS